MPVVDMTSHRCYWCSTIASVFLCSSCDKYTCRDCLLGIREDGCVHKTKNVVTSQTWDTQQNWAGS